MRAARQEVGTVEAMFESPKRRVSRGEEAEASITPEQFQAITSGMNKMLENILRQGEINAALVKRVLTLEQRLADLLKDARGPAVAGPEKAPSAIAPATAHAAVNGMTAPARAAGQTVTPPPAPQKDPLPIYMGDSIILCRVLNSFRMFLDTRDSLLTPQLLTTGIWEPALTRLLTQTLKAGMTVVDVGANAGYYTLLAAAVTGPRGRVIAFEADARSADILERNLELNGVGERVTLFRNCVREQRKTVDERGSVQNERAQSISVADQNRSLFRHPQLEAVALDDAIEGAVDFLKIDADGAEPAIFEGMKKLVARSPRLTILMEFNTAAMRSAKVDPSEFHAHISRLGFEIRLVTPQATLVPSRKENLVQQATSTVLLSRMAQ